MSDKAEIIPRDDEPKGIFDSILKVEDDEDELSKIFKQLTDPVNLHHYTELTVNEITAFNALISLEREFNIPELKRFIQDALTLRVSKKRKGRNEIVHVSAARQEQDARDSEEGFGFRRFFRRRMRGNGE